MLGNSAWTSLLWGLICVVVVLSLAYWFTKYVVGRGGAPLLRSVRSAGNFKVLSQLSVGKDQHLAVVQAGERFFLIGATPSQISLLAEFSPEEAQAWQTKTSAAGEDQQLPTFGEALQRVLNQRKQR